MFLKFIFLFLLLPDLFAARECPAIFKDLALLSKQANNPRFLEKSIAYDTDVEVKRFEEVISKNWRVNPDTIDEFIQNNSVTEPFGKYLKFSYTRWQDKSRIGIWLLHFKNEVLENIIKAKDWPALEQYKTSGKLPQNYVVATMKELGKEHGFKDVVSLPPRGLSSEEFFSYFKNDQLILDPNFKNQNHGENTHALQVLFLADMVDKEFGEGTMRSWYAYMAQDKIGGWQTWSKFFDSFVGDFTQPETLGPALRDLINPEVL